MAVERVIQGIFVKEQQRLDLIRKIENKRGSRVIVYMTSTRDGLDDFMSFDDIRIIEHHLNAIFRGGVRKLDLLLYTPGGYSVVPSAIVSLIREYLGPKGEFSVLIPSMAMSAGTIISLGADEIIMGPGGYIGPIDTQTFIAGQYESVETLRAYFELAKSLGLRSRRDTRALFLKLSDKISPLQLGELQRVINESERTAQWVLKSRRRPLGRRANRKIIRYLTESIGSHSQAIYRREALGAGLEFIRYAEHYGIDRFLSDLFIAYEQLLELDLPFARNSGFNVPGDEFDVNIDGEHAMEKPISLIESRDRLDIAKLAYGYRFWRDAPTAPASVPADQEVLASDQFGPNGGRFSDRRGESADDAGPRFISEEGPKLSTGLRWDTPRNTAPD